MDPQHASESGDKWDYRQICARRRKQRSIVGQPHDTPEEYDQRQDRHQRQSITHIGGAHEVTLLTLKPQTAHAAAIVHREPVAPTASAEDTAFTAARTLLA